MRKAYNCVEWRYLEAIMNKVGFSSRFVETIMRGVRSVTFSLPFNGRCTKEFKPTRGIHPRDPVSSYLFLLADEGLSCVLKHAMTSNEIEGIKIASMAPNISHLSFADNCITSDATKMK
jgi:hypothetical protein